MFSYYLELLLWYERTLRWVTKHFLIFIISMLKNALLEIIGKKKQYVQKSSSHAIEKILSLEKKRQREYYKQNSSWPRICSQGKSLI